MEVNDGLLVRREARSLARIWLFLAILGLIVAAGLRDLPAGAAPPSTSTVLSTAAETGSDTLARAETVWPAEGSVTGSGPIQVEGDPPASETQQADPGT